MERTRLAAAIVLFLLTAPAALPAQEQATPEQDLEAVAMSETAEMDAGPVEVALEASDTGVEALRRAEAAFALSAEDVKQLAVGPDPFDDALPASDSITIQTTTIIIALLVLILILTL